MKNIILSLLLITLVLKVGAETSGEAGFQMLKISSGAATSAQGGTGAFSADDAFGFMHNPAAAILQRSRVISIAQNYWLLDYQMNSGAYYFSNGQKSIGFGYRYLDYGKLESRDDVGNITGEFHPMDMVITANFAYRITPDLYMGTNLHGLYEKIDAASALGLALDFGAVYLTPLKDLKITAALKNLGKTGKMDQEDIKLPFAAEFGLTKDLNLNFAFFSNHLKIIKYSDNDDLQIAFGINSKLTELLSLRLGYKFNYDVEDISAGFGIKLKKLNMDYAYIPFRSEINDVHVIGLSYKF